MADAKIDPRSFISPPFRTCPKCGKESFGVLTISGNSYSRRCRDCWHMVNRLPLPKLDRKVIYLDQYVVSNLMKLDNPLYQRDGFTKEKPFYKELRDLLVELRRMQLIVCPDSASHVSESRISGFNAELKKTYENLSSGITFHSFESISSLQIEELARAWSDGREQVFHFNARNVLHKDPNEWSERCYITFQDNPFIVPSEIKAARTCMHTHIARLFRDVWSKETRTFQYWYDLERKGYQGKMGAAVVKSRRERLESMLAHRPDVEPSLEELGKVLPSAAEALLADLKHIMRFPRGGSERTADEIERLEKSFGQANRIAEAPFVKLQSMMYAAIAMSAAAGQKKIPDEGMTTDIETVAYLLPYCDAMLMDNGCRALLLKIPKTLRPAEVARVYSRNSRTAFLDYLRSIRASITPEHLNALREVYGEEHI
jgi:hypothetical protein